MRLTLRLRVRPCQRPSSYERPCPCGPRLRAVADPSHVVAAHPAACPTSRPADRLVYSRDSVGEDVNALTILEGQTSSARSIACPERSRMGPPVPCASLPAQGCHHSPYTRNVATWQPSITSGRLPGFGNTVATWKGPPHQPIRPRLPPATLCALAAFHNNDMPSPVTSGAASIPTDQQAIDHDGST